MDDGRTGCALQRVSRQFRELSKHSRLTSVCLYRSKDILRFEAVIDRLPPNERRVRYLHITSPHLFLDVSEDDDDGDYRECDLSSLDIDTDNDDRPSEGSLDENLEIDSDNSDSDGGEYQLLSIVEQEEVHNDITYLEAPPISEEYSAAPVHEGKDSMAEYKLEMDQANSIILAAVNNIISTHSSTLYALSIHWTKEFSSGYLSIPDFIPPSLNLPCLTELYLCLNLRSYTNDPTRDTYPESMFYGGNYQKKFNDLDLPALRRLRLAGLAWPYGRPYDVIRRIAPDITHIHTKPDLMGAYSGDFSSITFPMKLFIELPDETLPDRDEENVESLITDPEKVGRVGYHQYVTATIGMCIPEGYDADCWEAHWAAGLRGESGHWPEPGDLILSSALA